MKYLVLGLLGLTLREKEETKSLGELILAGAIVEVAVRA